MNRTVIVFFIFTLAIAAFLRLWDLREIPPGLYHDEAMNVNQAREAWRQKDFKIFYPENNGREGLFINIQALSIAAFGATPFAARLPSAIFGVLTVLGLYFLTKELFSDNDHQIQNAKIKNQNYNSKFKIIFNVTKNELIALFAAFFLATSFWHINFSRIGFRAIMAPFFLAWSMYFLWKLIGNKTELNFSNPKRGRAKFAEQILGIRDLQKFSSVLPAVIGGLLFGLGFHSYIAYRVTPLLLIIPFFIGWRMHKNSKLQTTNHKLPACLPCLLVLFLFFAFVAALPLGMYFLEHAADFVGRSSQVSIFSSEKPLYDLGNNIISTISMFFWRGDYNWRHNFAGAPQLWWPVAALFVVGIIVSFRYIAQNSKLKTQNDNLMLKNFKFLSLVLNFALCALSSAYGFLLLWFLVFLLPVVLSNDGLPHALRSLPLVIPAVIFSAIGLEWIIEKITRWLDRQCVDAPEKLAQCNRIEHELVVLLFVFLVAVAAHGFNQYFLRWSWNPHVHNAFNGRYADLGHYLATLPDTTKKYIIVNTPGHMRVDTIPMPAQTVMFFTDTWNTTNRAKKQFVYIPSADDFSLFPQTFSSPTVIAMLENDPQWHRDLKNRYPALTSKITSGGLLFTNY